MPEPNSPVAPRTDLASALLWLAVGSGAVVASWRMDRLESQGATLYSMPGLWPGIVGLLLALLGGVLAWRALLRARHVGWDTAAPDESETVPARDFRLAVALFFLYAVLLVGRGLPFWLGTALFVATFVFVFRRARRIAPDTGGNTRRDALFAIVCGAATAATVSAVFERLFYVRLP
jgi:protein-S-isoprenylcysteine O-methyltransferase Ste14